MRCCLIVCAWHGTVTFDVQIRTFHSLFTHRTLTRSHPNQAKPSGVSLSASFSHFCCHCESNNDYIVIAYVVWIFIQFRKLLEFHYIPGIHRTEPPQWVVQVQSIEWVGGKRIEYKYCLRSNNGGIIGVEHCIECVEDV